MGMKMLRENYGDFMELEKTHDEKKDIANIAECMEKLLEKLRSSGWKAQEETILIVIKSAPEEFSGPFGEPDFTWSRDKITVGLRCDVHKWVAVEEENSEDTEE